MTKDRTTDVLLDGLRQALSEPGEQRLYKSGKLAGLFAGKSGVNGDAAVRAVREGLLEVVRSESKGKTAIEWVKLTPAGVRFLHEQESPIRALEELRTTLQATREGVPEWLADMRDRVRALERHLGEDADRFLHQLDALSARMDEGLRRLHAAAPKLPDAVVEAVGWAADALDFLDQRGSACPLPDLFAALVPSRPDFSIAEFHRGLRALRDWHVVRLLQAENGECPQPEYALTDAGSVYYLAAR
jgi:hypothetical protein